MKEKLINRFDWLTEADVVMSDGRLTIAVEPAKLREIARFIKECGYDFLVDIVGIDYGDDLGTIYYIAKGSDTADTIALQTKSDNRENPVLPTICDIWEVGQV